MKNWLVFDIWGFDMFLTVPQCLRSALTHLPDCIPLGNSKYHFVELPEWKTMWKHAVPEYTPASSKNIKFQAKLPLFARNS